MALGILLFLTARAVAADPFQTAPAPAEDPFRAAVPDPPAPKPRPAPSPQRQSAPESEPVVSRPPSAAAAPPGFEGAWLMVLTCPPIDGRPQLNRTVPIQVSGGSFHGQDGVTSQPTWLTVKGTIAPDGTMTGDGFGLTGKPIVPADPQPGLPYSFNIVGKMAGASGSGRRVGGRDCDITIVRQAR
jgi:hypothetical protein